MLAINLQTPSVIAAFVMNAELLRRGAEKILRDARAERYRLNNPDRVKKTNATYRVKQREAAEVAASEPDRLVRVNLIRTDPTQTCVKCGEAKALAEFEGRNDRDRGPNIRRDCRECRKTASKSYYYQHVVYRDQGSLTYEQIRMKRRASSRASYARMTPERKERSRNRRQAWLQRTPEVMRALRAKRRAAEVAAPGRCSAEQLEARFAVYGYCCAYCGVPAEAADHVIPLNCGGSNWPANIRPSCTSCNSSKGDKSLLVWKAEQSAARSSTAGSPA